LSKKSNSFLSYCIFSIKYFRSELSFVKKKQTLPFYLENNSVSIRIRLQKVTKSGVGKWPQNAFLAQGLVS
jgi:hypothetical protein